ncbi:MAG: hypothetical protein J7515_02740 [Caulobacter sp.]|nr:hypothetical protein [Caulobacter sp.]
MASFDKPRVGRFFLGVVTITAAGLLAACGQGSKSTSVVLSGPADKVEALIAQHHLYAAPVNAHVEKLPDGGEKASFHKPGGIPAGELFALGKAAAKAGVNFEFSSGSEWKSGSSNVSVKTTPKPNGPVA